MVDKDDLTFLIIGVVLGGLGLLIYKLLSEKAQATSQIVWGAQYSYTPDGKLQFYMPVPLPINPQIQTVQMPQPQQTQETVTAKTTLF